MPLHSILRCSINSQLHLVCTRWLWGRGKVIEAVRSKVPTAVKQPLQHRAHTGAVASRLWQKDEPTYVNAASASNSSVPVQLLGYKQKLFTPTWASTRRSGLGGGRSRGISHEQEAKPAPPGKSLRRVFLWKRRSQKTYLHSSLTERGEGPLNTICI